MSGVTTLASRVKDSAQANPVAWWLFGCAGMVTTTLAVGAASPLTRSGVSMLYCTPTNLPFPPRTERDYEHVFSKYHSFCEQHRRLPLSFEEFKQTFEYEHVHRRLGQLTTLLYGVPLGYFLLKKQVPPMIQAHLAGVVGVGAAQMLFGRQLVEKNLKETLKAPSSELITYGMTYENTYNMVNLALLLWAAFHLVSSPSRAVKLRELTMSTSLKAIGDVRRYLQYATGMFLTTATAGTLVAGLDAGKEYNTFPKMGEHWLPRDMFKHNVSSSY